MPPHASHGFAVRSAHCHIDALREHRQCLLRPARGLGLGGLPPISTRAGPLNNITNVAAGGAHTCALTVSGGVKCWGFNGSGQLGEGSTMQRLTVVDVIGLSSGISAIATGQSLTCALTASGGVTCWGSHSLGQLGVGGRNYGLPGDVLQALSAPNFIPVTSLWSLLLLLVLGGWITVQAVRRNERRVRKPPSILRRWSPMATEVRLLHAGFES